MLKNHLVHGWFFGSRESREWPSAARRGELQELYGGYGRVKAAATRNDGLADCCVSAIYSAWQLIGYFLLFLTS